MIGLLLLLCGWALCAVAVLAYCVSGLFLFARCIINR
jgi:hypothetical protein